MASWGEFESAAPGLASFGASRLLIAPAFLATVQERGLPRVHPGTPIIGDGHVFVFTEPTSPKVHDLDDQGSYAMQPQRWRDRPGRD